MTALRRIAELFVLAALAVASAAQVLPSGQTVAIIPFENRSSAPGLQWISESFPELLQERLVSPGIYVLSREDRSRAYDRMGIPAAVIPSRATLFRVAEQLDVDSVVLGRYSFDGRTFTATAQWLDMHREHLSPEMTESGPLVQLISIENALAWDLLHALRPEFRVGKEAYVAAAPTIRLDAFENYVRGITDARAEEQIRHFREAVRLNPSYPEALLQLGKVYYRQRQYELAIPVFSKVPQNDPLAREANFYLGLSAYYQGDFLRAETAFAFVAARMPLPEVYNDLGVSQSRRGEKSAVDSFQRASDTDPNDPDYHFNLGAALYRTGDLAGASRQLHQVLQLHPEDGEAKSLLNTINMEATNRIQKSGTPSSRTPLERIRENYPENAFRELAFKLEDAAEQRLSKSPARTHAQYHVDRGRQFLTQGFVTEAEKEFREAVTLDPSSASAHLGLARALEENENEGARGEAEAALRLKPSADAYLVLAAVNLRENKTDVAADNIEQALRLDPSNDQALAMKRTVAAKLAEKAQPLPHP